MKKIILTKGLPASGKSTWAKEYQTENPNTVRVNKDDLRAMLHNGVWSHGREDFVLKIRNFIVDQALSEGHEVIVDDTNLAPKHEAYMRQVAKNKKAEFEVKDFTEVSPEVCIDRDLKRPNSVGSKVIKQMYRQFLMPKEEKPEFDVKLMNAVICDLDGTLALFGNENPYDRDFTKDELNRPVADIIRECSGLTILVSGRDEKYRDQTETWLKSYGIRYHALYMRPEGDKRKDVIVKKEIYDTKIKGKYNIQFVIDDRDQVVDLWRSLGMTCLQVNYGDF